MLESELQARLTYVKAANLIESNIRKSPAEQIGETRLQIFGDSEKAAQELAQLTLGQLSQFPTTLVIDLYNTIRDRARLVNNPRAVL